MPTIQHKRSSTGGAVPSAGSLAVGELGINLVDRKIYTKDASGNVVKLGVDELTGPQVLSPDAFLHIRNEQASGTAGGNSVGGAWTKVVLNTTKANTVTGASLASSVITLPAGNYYIKASAPFYKVARVKLRLRNTTAGTTLVFGTSEFTAGGDDVAIRPSLNGTFELTATSNVELQYYCTNSQGTNGLGVDSGFDTEVFADVEIWQYVDILGAEYPIQSSQLSTKTASSVSSTSWADIPSTSLDFHANAGDRVLLLFSGAAWQSSSGQNAAFVFNLDGTDVRSDATFGNLIVSYPTAGYALPVVITWVADITTTGVHTLKLRAKVSAGTVSLGDGTNHPRQMQAIRLAGTASAAGSLLRVTTFTSSGTWNRGTGTRFVLAKVLGGGGGGGGGGANRGGGGSAGGYSEKLIDVAAISSVSVTVGAGGNGGASDADGTAGGTSSFGTHCSAIGGGKGYFGNTPSAAPGAGSGGDINLSGGQGRQTPASVSGGDGGGSVFGSGAVGANGSVMVAQATTVPGTGGGGGNEYATPRTGTAGAAGIVIVYEYT